ncbi:MAG: hypothetical protein FVQ83_00385 [Chloroflexi bacterium]|nr:hypothetical protein [Chloroflexota bacterium]
MILKNRPNEKVMLYHLLDHPFYQAWNDGSLPLEGLKTYAEEYGAFITAIPQGWETLNDLETVEEEKEHAELWKVFADGLETQVGSANLKQTKALVEEAGKLFAQPPTAMGALYAFEVQQPETAQSKLAGLREFYDLPEACEKYFIEHTNNQHEAQKLLNKIDTLDEISQFEAEKAALQMSKLLWDALSGIHETCTVN